MPNSRYLLVKASVGFADRLQGFSHAVHYAVKYQRILCVDWGDSIWSDGTLDFSTYFDHCGAALISKSELLNLPLSTVFPLAWANQLERAADAKFIYKEEYLNPLDDADIPAELVVYASTGLRTFHVANMCQLRVKRVIRNLIVAQLRQYATYQTLVHLRGTDRLSAEKHDEYVAGICEQMTAVDRQAPMLVVSDCLPLFQRFQQEFPAAVLRTPQLAAYDPHVGTHLQKGVDKQTHNLEMLTDFFLLMYAPNCFHDPNTLFSKMARFMRCGSYCDILGYDP